MKNAPDLEVVALSHIGGAAASWEFPLPQPVHGVFVLLGTAAAVALLLREARRRRRLDEELLIVVPGALGCGALAAKLSTLWPYLQGSARRVATARY